MPRNAISWAIATGLAVLLVPNTALAAPPANDNQATARELTTAAPLVSNAEATTEAGEAVGCNPAGGGAVGYEKTLWYSFKAVAAIQYTVSTLGSSVDTVVRVTDPTGVERGCNDDGRNGYTSHLQWTANAGATYKIQVGTKTATAAGPIRVMVGPHTTDLHAGAAAVSPGTNAGFWTTAGAQRETGEDDHCFQAGGMHENIYIGKTVWLKYAPASTGTATFTARAPANEPPFDSVLQAFAGPALSAPIGCNDFFEPSDPFPSRVTIPVTAGQTYYLQVGSYRGDNPANTDEEALEGVFQMTTHLLAVTAGPGPTVPTNDTTPAFSFSSTAGGTYTCRLYVTGTAEGSKPPFATCMSPFTRSPALANTAATNYTFEVKLNTGETTTRTFTLDTTAPAAPAIGSGPNGPTNDTTPTFGFTGEAGASFLCRFDTAATEPAYAACTSAHTPAALAAGSYTFQVKARDAATNEGPVAARAFTLDLTPPATNITGGPADPDPTNDATPTFSFSSEAGATFECRVYRTGTAAPAFAACAGAAGSHTPVTPLADGSYKLEVRARDTAGNYDASPAVRAFSVDTGPPDTAIDSGPAAVTNSATPLFSFSSTDPDASFQCRIAPAGTEPGQFAACDRLYTAPPLADGDHALQVRAVDPAGSPDPTPAAREFRVDTSVPDTAIKGDPPGVTEDTTPAFAFESPEAGVAFECRVDADEFTPCASPFTAPALGLGDHTFEVRARDSAENVDQTPAAHLFKVDDFDRDDDGAARGHDCDDNDARRKPGTIDIAGNGVDEDCDNLDAIPDSDGDGLLDPVDKCAGEDSGAGDRNRDGCLDPPRIVAVPSLARLEQKRGIILTKLTVSAPAGSNVTIACLPATACRAQTRRGPRVALTRLGGTVRRVGRMRGTSLRPTQRLVIRVTKPGSIGHRITFLVVRGARASTVKRTDDCLAVGTNAPIACTAT